MAEASNRPGESMKGFTLVQLALLGSAAVGGLLAGTCLAVRRMLRNGKARTAIFIGYGLVGIVFAVMGVAIGAFVPAADVDTLRGALLIGAVFGACGVIVIGAMNIGSIITFSYLGLRVTIEPDKPRHDRRATDRRDNHGSEEGSS